MASSPPPQSLCPFPGLTLQDLPGLLALFNPRRIFPNLTGPSLSLRAKFKLFTLTVGGTLGSGPSMLTCISPCLTFPLSILNYFCLLEEQGGKALQTELHVTIRLKMLKHVWVYRNQECFPGRSKW